MPGEGEACDGHTVAVTATREIPGQEQAKMNAQKQSMSERREHLGWKPGWSHQRDGKGGWTVRPTRVQFLHWDDLPYWSPEKQALVPYGVAQMDNGQIILVGAVGNDKPEEKPVVTISGDGGESWTPWRVIDDSTSGRPMMLTYLGQGQVMFTAACEGRPTRFLSKDYGRTWDERTPDPVSTEGNYLVDRDANGVATRIAGFGIMGPWPDDITTGAFTGGVKWSADGGRTWSEPTIPKAWQWEEEFEGKVYLRGTSEGALARAANGWIVAALRMDMHPRFFDTPFGDNAEAIGVSISKDDGATWSPLRMIQQGGRQHAHLLCMADGTLVMTYIMRQDFAGERLATYRRGCGALLSRDNGMTWDTDHEYLVHSFDFSDGTVIGYCCGHVCSTALDDGSILTCYMYGPTKGACLIKWRAHSSSHL